MNSDAERWQRAKELVADALEKPRAGRKVFVESQLTLYPELREEVETLLAEDTASDSFLDSSPPMPRNPEEPHSALTGQLIGAWRLDNEIGRGGMGVVYLAERADGAYRQKAAVKLLRGAGRHDAARMARERQALASLNHANVARIIDGGTATDGTPYLVMEYVAGQSVDDYCSSRALGVGARVRLVRKIAAAVQNAHQQLLIHRDIKPSNIVVGEDGEPKLLDFGIARLIEGQRDASTTTQDIGLLFTPRYASPEQVKGLPSTVATDVYGLGALLYELLTAASPYARMETTDATNAAAVMRVVAEDEVDLPSRLAQRHAPAFAADLKGDLDTILMKACAKESADRYPTVAALGEDLDRWLQGRPILARPQSWQYLAGKFVSRHKLGTLLSLLALCAIVAGAAGTYVQKNKAEARYAQVRQIPNQVIFKYYDRIENLAGSVPVRRDMIKDALSFLDTLAADAESDPILATEIATGYRKLGEVMFNGRNMASLGDRAGGDAARAKAEGLLLQALRREPGLLGAQRELANVEADIGAVLGASDKGEEAMKRFANSVTRFRDVRARAPDDEESRFQMIRTLMATAQAALSNQQPARQYLDQAGAELAQWTAPPKTHDLDLVGLRMLYLRTAYREAFVARDIERALKFVDEELRLLDEHLARDPTHANMLHQKRVALLNSGGELIGAGRPADGLLRLEKALPLSEKLTTDDPRNIGYRAGLARNHFQVGRALALLGKQGEALTQFRKSIAVYEGTQGADLPPYIRRQQGEAYYALAKQQAAGGDKAGAHANALKLLAHAKKHPDLFSKPPASQWVEQATAWSK